MIDLKNVCDVQVEGIDHRDYPDFCDAFIAEAWLKIDGNNLTPDSVLANGVWYRPLTEAELDYINEKCGDFVYEAALESIF
jgi:hypothetical protein